MNAVGLGSLSAEYRRSILMRCIERTRARAAPPELLVPAMSEEEAVGVLRQFAESPSPRQTEAAYKDPEKEIGPTLRCYLFEQCCWC